MKSNNIFLELRLFSFAVLLGFSSNVSAQHVDPFTGNFSNSMQLISVPSPDGMSIPFSAYYNAGIAVRQSASEIGLGWDLGMGGAITRNVFGVPDDWNGIQTMSPQSQAYVYHNGCFYFNDGSPSYNTTDIFDIYTNVDSPFFAMPNYDSYSVSAPGMGGSIIPRLFDYSTITKMGGVVAPGYVNNVPTLGYDGRNFSTYIGASKKPQFIFGGDFADTLVSRHFQSSPFTSGDAVHFPNESVTYGSENSTDPYRGAVGATTPTYDGYNKTNGRLTSTRYIEYFTNDEINTGVSGFINFESGHDRSTGSAYDPNGIGGYRITEVGGYVYHFSLPVYINYTVNGNYPLKNDYTLNNYTNITTITGGGSNEDTLKKLTDYNNHVCEYKQTKKYAYQWLLTAITGPDYIDVNANGMADAGDKGYWVSFDYQKWTDSFTRRTPKYGFNYSFVGGDKDYKPYDAIDVSGKISGKFGTYTLSNYQVYYLNSVKTSTHTAIIVRDIRSDESSDVYQRTTNSETKLALPTSGSGTAQSNYGGIITDDNLGGTNKYSNNATGYVTISAPSGNKVVVSFNSFAVGAGGDGDYVKIFDGTGTGGTLLYSFSNSTSAPILKQSYVSTSNVITVQLTSTASGNNDGFVMRWKALSDKFIPQLKASKIALFTNDELASTVSSYSLTAITTAETTWDLTTTQASSAKFYHGAWWTANQSNIEAKTLETVEFDQDYSLARNYYNNFNTKFSGTFQLNNPAYVDSGISTAAYTSSGKLTLNKIHLYKNLHTKVDPPVLFDYNYSNPNDNPDYNPQRVDYWGFYKSDVTSRAYSGYVTDTSRKYTDAWSLRKITKPEGGTVDIVYESNTYEKVLGGDLGFQPARRIYGLKNAVPKSGGTLGIDWNFALEDSTVDFWNYNTLGYGKKIMIPFRTTDGSTVIAANMSVGTATITTSPNVLVAQKAWQTIVFDGGSNWFSYCFDTTNTSLYDVSSPAYTGNGYVQFSVPIGTASYGAGIRVQSLTISNGTDSYKQEYIYSVGVAASEADRFSQAKKNSCDAGGVNAYYQRLNSYSSDPFKMGSRVGYSSVTMKNKGHTSVNEANGSTVYDFLTNDAGYKNFKRNIVNKTVTGGCDYIDNNYTSYVYEIIDEFSSAWGLPLETKVYDKNNNMIARNTNTLSVLKQGSLVENFHVYNSVGGVYSCGDLCVCNNDFISHGFFIYRQFPVYITSQTTYNKNEKTTTEYLKFDEITFEPRLVKTTAPNGSVNITKSTPAFRISDQLNLGPKSKDANYYNLTSAPGELKNSSDSATITGNANFSNYSYNVYKKTADVRELDKGVTNKWKLTTAKTLTTYFSPKGYTWTGALSSYGLYDHTALPSPPTTYTTTPNANWRIGEEILLLDYKGHVLETRAYNNRFSSSKYCDQQRLLSAQATNVNYASWTFTGFEDTTKVASTPVLYSGEVDQNGGVWTVSTATIVPHTGGYTTKVPTNTVGPIWLAKYTSAMSTVDSLQKGRTYRGSVWVHTSSPNTVELVAKLDGAVGGTGTTTTVTMAKNSADAITIGSWIQLNVEITVPTNYISQSGPAGNNDLRFYLNNPSGSGGDAWFDDFVVHPIDAPFSAKVYEPRTKWLSAEIDNNNFATKYVYDNGGRIKEIWKEIQGVGLKKIKSFNYNTQRELN